MHSERAIRALAQADIVYRDPSLTAEESTEPGLVERIYEFALAAKPLLEFGWQIERQSARSSPDFLVSALQ